MVGRTSPPFLFPDQRIHFNPGKINFYRLSAINLRVGGVEPSSIQGTYILAGEFTE
jgi:hypothetical protein